MLLSFVCSHVLGVIFYQFDQYNEIAIYLQNEIHKYIVLKITGTPMPNHVDEYKLDTIFISGSLFYSTQNK